MDDFNWMIGNSLYTIKKKKKTILNGNCLSTYIYQDILLYNTYSVLSYLFLHH